MIKIKKYQIEDYISDATQDALDLKADLVNGKVPASQLPSFVDDVIEVANYEALPIPGATGVIYITLDNNKVFRWTGSVYVEIASGSTNLSYTPGVSDGTVNSDTGTDATIPLAGTVNAGLFSAAEKTKLGGIAAGANVGVVPNAPITGATKTKITYDAKGLVTAGADATTADIADSTNKRYVTDANLTTIGNQSGTNTGDNATNTQYSGLAASKQDKITLTTTGTSGASTLVGATLNIPQYSGATNLGYNPSPTEGTVTSSTGTSATLPLADGTNAGLLTAAEKTKISNSVPYTGATSDVNLGEFGIQLGNLEFDNTPTNTPTAAGSMVWNDSDGTVDLILKGGNVTLQIGQESVIRVVNKTATNVTLLEADYQAVRVTGAQGQRLKVDLAQATTDGLSAETIGLVTETIANNQEGFVTTSGIVRNINTTGSLQGETWLDGDILYLSPTVPGRSTKVKPTAPNHLIIIGYVISAHITQGSIFVKVDNGYELDELHNVKITSVANNNVLAYTSATDIWENKTVATALGFTPANDANVVHLAGDETITGIKTFTETIIASGSTGVYAYNGDKGVVAFGDTTGVDADGGNIGVNANGGNIGVSANGETLQAGVFNIPTENTSNIVEFQKNNVLKAAIQNDGKITATAGTASTDVVVKSQLDTKQDTITLSAIGAAPNANAATLTGSVLNLQPASASFGGVVTTAAQTFAGIKTFNSNIVIPATGSSLILSVSSGGTVSGLTTTTYPSPGELIWVKGVTSSIQTQFSGKQATLISGNNIKSINGNTILGSGDLVIPTAQTGQIIVTTGSTFTVPAGVTAATVFNIEIIGAGGGGAGSANSTAGAKGSAGGGGGYCFIRLTGLTPGNYVCSIGTAGLGSALGVNASSGTATTLTILGVTYTANGGGGGLATGNAAGGVGGTATNGNINYKGQNGSDSVGLSTVVPGALGGDSHKGWGLGGSSVRTGIAGNNATGNGGGGSGGHASAGGNGSNGIIFAQWFN